MSLPPYGTIAGLAWRQFLNRFDIILFSQTLFNLPVLAVIWYVKQWYPLPETALTIQDYWPNLAIQLALDYGASVITSITVIMIVLAMQLAVKRQPTNFAYIFGAALRLYPWVVLLSLVELLLTVLGLSLFVLPGLLVTILFAMMVPAYVWYKLSPWQALLRSVQLVRKHFWMNAFYILLTQLLVTMVVMLTTWGLPTTLWFNIFSAWVGAICASFYTVYVTILMTLNQK
ncbi:MAG TPA: hypothetical protein DEG44_04435 [Candidatus Kerfeldbacteria bacterium]|nr:hypothetical protein [Candidatus Kerfeldbacteria bacterium]